LCSKASFCYYLPNILRYLYLYIVYISYTTASTYSKNALIKFECYLKMPSSPFRWPETWNEKKAVCSREQFRWNVQPQQKKFDIKSILHYLSGQFSLVRSGKKKVAPSRLSKQGRIISLEYCANKVTTPVLSDILF